MNPAMKSCVPMIMAGMAKKNNGLCVRPVWSKKFGNAEVGEDALKSRQETYGSPQSEEVHGALAKFTNEKMVIRSRKPLMKRLQPNFIFPGAVFYHFFPIFLKPRPFGEHGEHTGAFAIHFNALTTLRLYDLRPQLKSCNLILLISTGCGI